MSMTKLRIYAIEWRLFQDGIIITPELDDMLHAYYENRMDIQEVNVARYCQIQIAKSLIYGIPDDLRRETNIPTALLQV